MTQHPTRGAEPETRARPTGDAVRDEPERTRDARQAPPVPAGEDDDPQFACNGE